MTSDLYAEEWGGGPPAVLLHGGLLDRRQWDELVPPLARARRVVRYDLRGFGRSPTADAPFSHHEDLRDLLDALDVESAALVGHSLGAGVAVDFALTCPERVDRLVLMAPSLSGWLWSAEERGRVEAVEAVLETGDVAGAVELWTRGAQHGPTAAGPAVAPRARELMAENVARLLEATRAATPLDPPAVGRLRELGMPTLVIVGARDVPDVRHVAELLARVQGATKVVLPGVGHLPDLEAPAVVSRLVCDFLGVPAEA